MSARYVRNQSRVSGPNPIRLRLHGPCLFERSVDGEETCTVIPVSLSNVDIYIQFFALSQNIIQNVLFFYLPP